MSGWGLGSGLGSGWGWGSIPEAGINGAGASGSGWGNSSAKEEGGSKADDTIRAESRGGSTTQWSTSETITKDGESGPREENTGAWEANDTKGSSNDDRSGRVSMAKDRRGHGSSEVNVSASLHSALCLDADVMITILPSFARLRPLVMLRLPGRLRMLKCKTRLLYLHPHIVDLSLWSGLVPQ